MSIQTKMIDVMSGRARSWHAGMLRCALCVLEPIYSEVATRRNRSFNSGRRKMLNAGRPVISVGNITTGGTGKTPIVAWIANHLRDHGERPAILLRGYKSSNAISDEAQLLTQLAARSPVMAKADRVAGAAELLKRDPSISCFLLDDGFQHRRIVRQLDLVLIDATAPFGFEHVLPRGLLREPIEGLQRCDGVIITRCDRVSRVEVQAISERVRLHLPRGPILRCSLSIDHFLDEQDRRHTPSEAVAGYALCGIGNPRNFVAELATAAPLRGETIFADHYAYQAADLTRVIEAAIAAKAERLLTTEKDWVKLNSLSQWSRLPVWRAVQTIRWAEGDEEKLAAMLAATLNSART